MDFSIPQTQELDLVRDSLPRLSML